MPLLDSNILIDFLRQRNSAREAIKRALEEDRGLVSSAICRAEVLGGMRPDEEVATRSLLDQFMWLDVTVDITEVSSEYFRRYRSSRGLNLFDSIIAATASVHNLELFTANRKHFPMKDIRIVQPYN